MGVQKCLRPIYEDEREHLNCLCPVPPPKKKCYLKYSARLAAMPDLASSLICHSSGVPKEEFKPKIEEIYN